MTEDFEEWEVDRPWRIRGYSLFEHPDAHIATRETWFSVKDDPDIYHLPVDLRIASVCRAMRREFDRSDDPDIRDNAAEYSEEMGDYLTWLEGNWN